MRPDEFADAAADDGPVEALSAEEQAGAEPGEMVLLDSADDLPAYRPEEAGSAPPAEAPADDDAGLTFSDSANPTARFGDAPAAEAPAAPARSPSGRQPPARGRTPGGTRRPSGAAPRPSGRLRKGPPSRRSSPSEGSSVGELRRGTGRHPRQGTETGRHARLGSESGRHERLGTETGRHARQASETGRVARPGSETGRQPRLGSESGRQQPGGTRSRPRLASEHSASAASAVERLRGRSERPERDPADAQAALAQLEALVQPAPANDPFMGRDVGQFKVQQFLELVRGERRYLAFHEETKSVCLLRVFPFLGAYGDEFKRIADRGERAARVEHPNLDLSVGVGRTKECFYVGTRPPWGPTLAEKLAQGKLPRAEVLEVLDQVGRGLKALHAREMFHANLSPDAIREEAPGHYVIHEAGTARARAAYSFLSAGGDVLGTPGYIAPETVDAGGSSRAADIYALGCMAWTMIAGRTPFETADEVQVLLDQLNHVVPRLDAADLGIQPEVEPGLAIFVSKMTGYTTDVRYPDTTELLNDLRALRQGEAVKPFGDAAKPEDELQGKAVSTGTTLAIALLLLNFAVAGYVALVWWQGGNVQLNDPLVGYELPLNATGE